jgi:hypothetical protein
MKNFKLFAIFVLGLAVSLAACKTKSPSQPDDEGTGTNVTLSADPVKIEALVGTWNRVTVVLKDNGAAVSNFTIKFQTDIGELATEKDLATGTASLGRQTDSNGSTYVWVRSAAPGTGTLRIVSSTPHVASANVPLKFTDGTFAVNSISPTSGGPLGGQVVHIYGSGFTTSPADRIAVLFGTEAVTEGQVVSDGELAVVVPAAPQGSSFPLIVDVTVTIRVGLEGQNTKVLLKAFRYTVDPPEILRVSPAKGSPEGGTTVTVTGSGFNSSNAEVRFGGVPAHVVLSRSATELVVLTPVPPAGTTFPWVVAVSVVNDPTTSYEAIGTYPNAYTYDVQIPVVTKVTPVSGRAEGGEEVVIEGHDFSVPNVDVFFGSRRVTEFISKQASLLRVKAPAPPTGIGFPVTVDVKVVNNPSTAWASQATIASAYTYELLKPVITSVDPPKGYPDGNTTVVVRGRNFNTNSAGVEVLFGERRGVVSSSTATEIVVRTPRIPDSQSLPFVVDVTVTNSPGTEYAASTVFSNGYTFQQLVPHIEAVSPDHGLPEGNDTVTITGHDFDPTDVQVKFGERVVTEYLSKSSTQIVVKSPVPDQAGDFPMAVIVRVTNRPNTTWEQSTFINNGFIYATPIPSIASVDPRKGSRYGGDTVTIYGSNFLTLAQGLRVEFLFAGGTRQATITRSTPTEVTVVTPVPPTGTDFTSAVTVGIKVTNYADRQYWASGELPNAFTYDRGDIPTITSVTPRTGGIGGGNRVVIKGNNFCNPLIVRFGEVVANVLSVTPTEIQVYAPAAPTGTDPMAATAVDICITCQPPADDPGPFCAQSAYVYGCEALPQISSISPNNGPIEGGTVISIFGSGFTTGMQAYFYDQANFEHELSTSFVSNSEMRVVSPPINVFEACQIGLPMGVRVRNAFCGASSVSPVQFFYKLSWAISSNTPAEGLYLGGTEIRVYGQGFTYPLTASIGGTPALVQSVSDTMVVVISQESEICGGGSAISLCSVQFAECACASGGSFKYDPPEITSVTPATLAWPSAFPATVTINGIGFRAPMSVSWAGYDLIVPAGQVSADGTQMTVTLPRPGSAAMEQVDCVSAGGCNGKQYVLTPLQLRVSPTGIACAADWIELLNPDDQSCRVVPTTSASFTAANGAAANHTVAFTDSSVPTSGGTIVSWSWSFGDGGTSTAQNPSHDFGCAAACGTYTVQLRVTDSCGGVATTSGQITPP